MIKGRVIKCLSNKFTVDTDNEFITCSARKRIKKDSDILVGDFIELEFTGDEHVLNNVLPRKNSLIRPPISNIDQLIITIAPVPDIDYFLIDKLIINAHEQNIKTILCLNKTDIMIPELFVELKGQYNGIVDNILKISAINGDFADLRDVLRGNLSCFTGQSAVGKSSIINALTGLSRSVGELSNKNLRGKNTTSSVELIKLEDKTFIVDTPGFSMIDIHNIYYDELSLYYGEYVELSINCRFNKCTHTAEPDCAVKKAVENGMLNKRRYERYCLQFETLKKQKNDYKKMIY